MKKFMIPFLIAMCLFSVAAVDPDCESTQTTETARSGVTIAQQDVKVQADGKTLEQSNISRRLELENTPGAIQHLYILSAYSGQVLLYSTVKGKVTSSGKRLSPSTQVVQLETVQYNRYYPEVLGDDGTYGSSSEYLFWYDIKGIYHQQYVTGGMLLHISNQPMQFGRVTMQVESTKE